jgi:APA family basic amino acid/polyamine antiporter
MISTFGTTNAIILATARVYFSMAQRNVFPAFIGRAHPRFHTPTASLVVQGIWSVLLLFSGTFDTLTDMLIFVSWVFYAAGAFGIFVLRRKEPDVPRPYKVPGYPFVPIVFILFSLLYLVLTVINDIQEYQAGHQPTINSAFGTALVLIGMPIYFIYRKRGTIVEP